MSDSFIVKVQISLTTTERTQQVLIYDKSHKHIYEGDATKEIIEIMGDRKKDFFKAHLQGSLISLDRRVGWQHW